MGVKRLGVLTGGGDVPGLNSVIKSAVYRGAELGFEVIGIRRGWEGLTHLDARSLSESRRQCPKCRRIFKTDEPFEFCPLDATPLRPEQKYVMPLNRGNTRTIDRTGGTFLHSSRTNPSKMKVEKLPEHLKASAGKFKEVKPGVVDVTPAVLENLQALQIDGLIVIGGDDTISYCPVLEQHGFPIIAVPKTMDNDVRNTEYCIGFSTAVTRAVAAITRQRTTVGSHERIGIFRIFGRDAGHTAIYTAYVTSIRCCIPEYRFNLHKLIELLVNDKRHNPSNYSLVVISEGAVWEGEETKEYGEADAFGHRKKVNIGEALSDQVKKLAGEETIVSDLTYDLRSGEPDFVDKMVATTFANMALDCLAEGHHGRMMAIQNGCYMDADIPDPKLGPRHVDVATMYNVERYRPNYTGKRGLPIFLTRS